jgi:hypothetical protein
MAVHILQRCPKQNLVGLSRRVREVLSVLNFGLDKRSGRRKRGVGHDVVDRFAGLSKIDVYLFGRLHESDCVGTRMARRR